MAEQLGRKEIQHYARLGAEARLAALEREREAILRSFPDLAGRRNARGASARTPAGRGRPRGASNMSAAARKAVSVRMKKYWASRRKAKAAAKNA